MADLLKTHGLLVEMKTLTTANEKTDQFINRGRLVQTTGSTTKSRKVWDHRIHGNTV